MASSSSSSSWYPPDASFLFYTPPKPNFPRPPSPPRRSATSAQDARHASYLSELQSLAESKSLFYHGVGDHLPARGDASGQEWKEEGRRREVLRGGSWWSGSGVNEEEERWLNAEEAAREEWRESVKAFGQSNIVLLGRGRTMQEETTDRADRDANSHLTSQQRSMTQTDGDTGGGGDVTMASQVDGATIPRATGGGRSSRRRGGAGTAAEGTTRRATTTTRTPGATATTTTGSDPRSTSTGDEVFEGEYTLDNGAGEEDDSRAGNGGDEGDLDAGLESMD